MSAFSVPLEDSEPDTSAADPRVWAQHVETIDRLIAENARLRDSLARTKAAHDRARQILGADVEPIEDAAARVVRERDEALERDEDFSFDRCVTDIARALNIEVPEELPLEVVWHRLVDLAAEIERYAKSTLTERNGGDQHGRINPDDGAIWFPVACKHGWDHCPTCDAGLPVPPLSAGTS